MNYPSLDYSSVSGEHGGDIASSRHVEYIGYVEQDEGGVVLAKLGEEVLQDEVELQSAGEVGGRSGQE